VIGLLVSQRDLDLQQMIATELTAYPSSMFHANGQIWVATGKSTLKTISMDVSAVLWTVDWLVHRTVDTFVSGFKVWLSVRLLETDVHLCFDRYRDYSTKSSTRSARASATTRFHTPLPTRDSVLKYSANKIQLNTIIYKQILDDQDFLQDVTQEHQLVVTGDEAVPTQVSKRLKMSYMDLVSTHEEADIIITQQAINIAKKMQNHMVVFYVMTSTCLPYCSSSIQMRSFSNP